MSDLIKAGTVALSIVLSSIGVSNTWAENIPLMPLLDDATAHENLPSNGVYDLRGFTLLDDANAIEALKSDFPEKDYHWRLRSETRGLSDGRGNKVQFQYGPTTYSIERKEGFEVYYVQFTSALLGNRAFSVDLNTAFREKEIGLQSLLDAFDQKYGAASVSFSVGSTHELIYIVEKGQLLRVSAEDYAANRYKKGTVAGRISDCFLAKTYVSSVGSLRVYNFKQDRARRYPHCNGGMHVKFTFGARPDLVRQMIVHIWDADLSHRNDVTQDQFLLEALHGNKASKTGAEAPKL